MEMMVISEVCCAALVWERALGVGSLRVKRGFILKEVSKFSRKDRLLKGWKQNDRKKD